MMRNELHFVSIADRTTKHLRDHQWWDAAPSRLSSSDHVFAAKKKKKKNSTSPLLSSAFSGSRSKNKKNMSRSSNSIESGKRSKQEGGEEEKITRILLSSHPIVPASTTKTVQLLHVARTMQEF
jgi:hypothetical protein